MATPNGDSLSSLHAPLNAPAVEVIDISPKDEYVIEHSLAEKPSERDASIPDEDDKWTDTLETDREEGEGSGDEHDELSLYEEFIDRIDDEGELDQGMESNMENDVGIN